MTEIDKLEKMLIEEGIEYERKPLFGGWQICVPNAEYKEWDAICHSSSYGHERGLLEIMGDCLLAYEELQYDNVLGYMTAEEVMNRVHDQEQIAKVKREYEDNLDWWKSQSIKTQNDLIKLCRCFLREEVE